MKRFLIFAISIMAFIPSFSQDSKVKRPDSYNYQRGVEAIQKENSEEALEYLNKEIKDNPKNGYAFSWIAMVRCHQEEYGRALTAADLALKNLPKKDKEYIYTSLTKQEQEYIVN